MAHRNRPSIQRPVDPIEELGRVAARLYLWNWHMVGVRYLDCSMNSPARTVWDMGSGYVFCAEDETGKDWAPAKAPRPTLIGQYAFPDFRDAATRGCLRAMVEKTLGAGESFHTAWWWESGERLGCFLRLDVPPAGDGTRSGIALHPHIETDEVHALVAALAAASAVALANARVAP